MIKLKGKYETAKIFTDNCEAEAQGQILDMCNNEVFKNSHIRIMPDVHAGKGCTIGTTLKIQDKIIPNMVGVDIGCGMGVMKLKKDSIDSSFDLEKFDNFIRNNIPAGFNIHEHIEKGIYNIICLESLKCHKDINLDRACKSIGTLGGGNHFIEIDENETNYYFVVHTGSRNLGKQVCEYYQKQADDFLNKDNKNELGKIISDLKAERKQSQIQNAIQEFHKNHPTIKEDMAYLEGQLFDDYIHDMKIVQEYASLNRTTILRKIYKSFFDIGIKLGKKGLHVNGFETIHNYIDVDNMILRKGSVSAKKGEELLIPINMKDGSLLCRGKGNEDWNYSAPHGAGRLMSRKKAKSVLEMKEFQKEMEGVYSTSVVESTLDESPMAYKSMDEIVKNIEPTAEIISHLKPIYNFKAS